MPRNALEVAALRGLAESIRLSRRLAAAARERGSEPSATWHDEIARANEGHASVLRELVAVAPAESGEEATP
jgi:hypothetical protein